MPRPSQNDATALGARPPAEALDSTARITRTSLNFWFGPKKIGRAWLRVREETWAVGPFGKASAPPPSVQDLAGDLDGVFRRSEPLESVEPRIESGPETLRYIESSFERQFIDFSTDFETYLAGFSRKTRSTITRKLRRFEKSSGGEIDWRRFQQKAEMRQFHRIARQVSSLTYQEKLFDAGIPDGEDFIAQMEQLADKNAARGYVLFLDGKPISYLYLPIVDGRVIYNYLGFDPAFSNYSPGTVLQFLALKCLFAEKAHRFFDFTEGEGPHKRLFSTHRRLCGNVFYLRPTVRNRMLIFLHSRVERSASAVDRLLAHLRLKTFLKKLIRGRTT